MNMQNSYFLTKSFENNGPTTWVFKAQNQKLNKLKEL